MSAYTERIKLEAMFYHARDPKHVAFLENNELYAYWRTINTFKGGKTLSDPEWVRKTNSKPYHRGMTQNRLN